MKRKWIKRVAVVFLSLLLVVLAVGLPIYFTHFHIPAELAYSQEYVVGAEGIVGSVNTEKFLAWGDEFEIGANSEGVAVFKNPFRAFRAFKRLYANEIKILQKEFDMKPLTQFNYRSYMTLSWQSTSEVDTDMVSSFLDIYENSFNSFN